MGLFMKSTNYLIAAAIFILLSFIPLTAKQPPVDLGYEPPAGWEFVMKLDSISSFDIYSHNDTCYLWADSYLKNKYIQLFLLTTNGGETWADNPEIPRPLMFIKNTLISQAVRFEDPYYYYKKSYDFYKTSEKYSITGNGLPFDSLYQSPIDTNLLIANFTMYRNETDYSTEEQWPIGNSKAFISRDAGKTWAEMSNLYRHPEYLTIYKFNFDWAEKGHWFVNAIDGDDIVGYRTKPTPPVNLETFDDGKTFRQIKFDPIGNTDYEKMQFGLDGKNTYRNILNKYDDIIRISEYSDTIMSYNKFDWLYLMEPNKPKSNKDSGYYRSLFTLFYEFDYSNYSNIFLPTIENFNDSTYANKIYIYNSLFQSNDNGKSWKLLNQLNELPLLRKIFLDQGTKTLWLFVKDEKYKPGQHQSYLKGSLWKLKLDWESTSVENIENKGVIKIYPNPAREYILISGSIGTCSNEASLIASKHIQIFDILGINVSTTDCFAATSVSGGQRIDVSFLPTGMYFIKIGNKVEKFVKM
jgi:hypothetical protein